MRKKILPLMLSLAVHSFLLTSVIYGDTPYLSYSSLSGYSFSDGVDPDSGNTSTSFTFKVIYTDYSNHQPMFGFPKLHILSNGFDISGSPFSMSEEYSWDLTYSDGKQYTYTNTIVAGSYSYYFEAADAGWSYSSPTSVIYGLNVAASVNVVPVLSWPGDTNYSLDGIHPETGDTTSAFTFRVKYVDSDGDAPASGYPKVHIKKGGTEIAGSPFDMLWDSGSSFTAGEIYAYSRTLPGGTDYRYYFEARDSRNGLANGSPANSIGVDSPDVSFFSMPTSGLIGYWKFDDAIGTTADDSSPQSGDATIFNASWITDGKYSGALSFNSFSSYLECMGSGIYNLSSGFTLGGWIYANTNSYSKYIMGKGNGAFALILESNNRLRFDSGFSSLYTNYFIIQNMQWTHVTAVFTGSEKIIYVNGTEKTRTNSTNAPGYSFNDFTIGRDPSTSGLYFDGKMDEMFVYNRALAASEVSNIANHSVAGTRQDNKISIDTNVFNPYAGTSVKITLPQSSGNKTVRIYNSAGDMVKVLLDHQSVASVLEWYGKDESNSILSPGIYYITFEIDDKVSDKQKVLLYR